MGPLRYQQGNSAAKTIGRGLGEAGLSSLGSLSRSREQFDLLGVSRVPAQELRTLAQIVDSRSVAGWLTETAAGDFLGRGPRYYAARHSVADVHELLRVVRSLAALPGGSAPITALLALLDSTENALLQLAHTCYVAAIDGPAAESERCHRRFDELVKAATSICRESWRRRLGIPRVSGTVDFDQLEQLTEEPAPGALRRFRELDSKPKMLDECRALLELILPESASRELLLPLYGAFGLGVQLRALAPVLRPEQKIETYFLRLGFHDQGSVPYYRGDGSFDLSRMMPKRSCTEARERLRQRRVLIVDDNVGYGTTLRAARGVVQQLGAFPITRAVETAWHLFERSVAHHIADVVDYPSLRSNFHHGAQSRFIELVERADAKSYLAGMAAVPRQAPLERRANLALARRRGGWSPQQLDWLERELAASASWDDHCALGKPVERAGAAQ